MRVELLFWEGGPWRPVTLALLEDVLTARGVGTTVEQREIKTQTEAAG